MNTARLPAKRGWCRALCPAPASSGCAHPAGSAHTCRAAHVAVRHHVAQLRLVRAHPVEKQQRRAADQWSLTWCAAAGWGWTAAEPPPLAAGACPAAPDRMSAASLHRTGSPSTACGGLGPSGPAGGGGGNWQAGWRRPKAGFWIGSRRVDRVLDARFELPGARRTGWATRWETVAGPASPLRAQSVRQAYKRRAHASARRPGPGERCPPCRAAGAAGGPRSFCCLVCRTLSTPTHVSYSFCGAQDSQKGWVGLIVVQGHGVARRNGFQRQGAGNSDRN